MRISIGEDNVNFKPVEVNSLAEFINYATQYNYSTGVFRNDYRNKANFLEAQSIAIDVDNDDPNNNYTIEDAALHFINYKHIIMPSKSHRIEKNGRIADRFRVILFLEDKIEDAKDFTATWNELLKFYPAADLACKDASRFYYPSTDVHSITDEGKCWPVTKYVAPIVPSVVPESNSSLGQLSASTMQFLTYGAPAGKRNVRLFKAAKDMQEQGFGLEECKLRVSMMIQATANWGTDFLNETDIMTINNAYKETPKYQPREGEVTRKSVFNFQSIDTMVKEAGNVNWLVEDLLTVGGFSIMVGPPKTGKSTLVRQLIKSIAHGSEFLGRKVQKGGILYLTFEEQPSILKEQFNAIGITSRDPVIVHVGSVFDDRALPDLEEAIHEFTPQLVVLDTMFDISQLESIDNYKEVKDALAKIRNIARNTEAHILGVHHTNKTGKFMGSQAIFGAVDAMITFVQERERRYLFSTGKHGVHFQDQEILFNPTNQSYVLGDVRERKVDRL